MISRIVSLFVVFSVTLGATSEEDRSERAPLSLMLDSDIGMQFGSANLYTGHQLLMKADDFVLMIPGMMADSWYGRLMRFGKLALVDVGCTTPLTMLVQHEIFGHGARLREFGLDPSYRIDIPYLLIAGGGVTKFDGGKYMDLGAFERVAVDTGGVESTYVMSQRVLQRQLSAASWDYRDALLYAMLMLDQPFYTESLTDDLFSASAGHDIELYVDEINFNCNREALSRKRLKRLNWINYLDTGLVSAIYSAACFVKDGDVHTDITMFSAGNVSLMPFARVVLAPWGPEYGGGSWFSCGQQFGMAYIRYGETCDIDSYAMGVKLLRLYQLKDWDFGFRCEAWKQPPATSPDWVTKKQFGALFTGLASVRLGERWSAELELGGKSEGFVLGEPLRAGPVLRGFVNLHGF